MPLKFNKMLISAEAFESAGVWDVDGDGMLDIVSGGFWYKGPEFKQKYKIGDVARYSEYYDDFSTIPMDINGNGRLDIITGGWWGDSLRWWECPSDPTQEWKQHILADKIGNVETTRAWDMDGDGELEIVPNTPGQPAAFYKLIKDGAGKGTGKFSRHLISPNPVGHGFGFGDVDGDGRGEFVVSKGYFKPPADPLKQEWKHIEEWDLGGSQASCPILVADVNGDGRNDLIVGRAHSYGLDWWEQKADSAGKSTWVKHPIDPWVSQYHDLQWIDIDGDGTPELITGRRHRAHNGNDPGEYDALGCYYFKWNGESFTKQVIDYVQPGGSGGGVGILFALADLRKTGRLDVVAPGKDGLYVYYNEGL